MKTPFEQDLEKQIAINNGYITRGEWNLILSIRDCKLYSKGIKPHRNWKISHVKFYFGITGTAQSIVQKLEEMYNKIKNAKDEDEN